MRAAKNNASGRKFASRKSLILGAATLTLLVGSVFLAVQKAKPNDTGVTLPSPTPAAQQTPSPAAKSAEGQKTPQSVAALAPKPSISLVGTLAAADVQLRWTPAELDTRRGFYVLRSASPGATFPANNVTPNGVSAATFTGYYPIDGQKYYYRVCQIATAGGCGTYSNEVPLVSRITSSVASIAITGVAGLSVNWEFSSQAYGGFVVLWSTSPQPTLPSSTTVHSNQINNPIATNGVINSNVVSGQTYYVRVCENLGGACGTYSNQVTVTAP